MNLWVASPIFPQGWNCQGTTPMGSRDYGLQYISRKAGHERGRRGAKPPKTKNSKHEIRNSKQFQITKKEERVSSDACQGTRDLPLDTRPSTLAPFGFRYSDFGFLWLCLGARKSGLRTKIRANRENRISLNSLRRKMTKSGRFSEAEARSGRGRRSSEAWHRESLSH
jgi:hypothetical protein